MAMDPAEVKSKVSSVFSGWLLFNAIALDVIFFGLFHIFQLNWAGPSLDQIFHESFSENNPQERMAGWYMLSAAPVRFAAGYFRDDMSKKLAAASYIIEFAMWAHENYMGGTTLGQSFGGLVLVSGCAVMLLLGYPFQSDEAKSTEAIKVTPPDSTTEPLKPEASAA